MKMYKRYLKNIVFFPFPYTFFFNVFYVSSLRDWEQNLEKFIISFIASLHLQKLIIILKAVLSTKLTNTK